MCYTLLSGESRNFFVLLFRGCIMQVTETKTELTIVIEKNAKPTQSASGKSLIIATTHGNIPTVLQVDGKPVIVSVNAYVKN